MKAIVIDRFGDYNNLSYRDYPEPVPNDNQILVETKYIGVNFADLHQTENSYLVKSLPPLVPGAEVTFERFNKRFVGLTSNGSYSEKALVNKNYFYEIPDGVSDQEALACISQGTTAYIMVNEYCNVTAKDVVLINGASSGVGIFLIQLCKQKGAKVIAITSNIKKAELVKSIGADLIFLSIDDIPKEHRPTVVFDSYGGKYFSKSLRVLKNKGSMCFYGASSRESFPHIDLVEILKESKKIIGFWINNHISDKDYIEGILYELFKMILEKNIKVVVGLELSLKQAKDVHMLMSSRNTFGKLILKND